MRSNSNILRKHNMRSGIAMIMAIGFMVIIAGILATMMNLTSVTSKRTENMYFKEQAQLLAKSATEFALLAISAHDRSPGGVVNSDCITNINSQFPSTSPYFNIRTNIQYIGLPGATLTCAGANYIPVANFASGQIAPESDGTVLIDVYVTSTNVNLSENIIYHRRTLQKP